MKTAEQFLIENRGKIRSKNNGRGDYRRLYPETTVIELMKQFSEQENESLTKEIQDQENLLAAFCWYLKEHGVTFSEDYTQEYFKRIARSFLFYDDNPEE